jgi:hypothetical protein
VSNSRATSRSRFVTGARVTRPDGIVLAFRSTPSEAPDDWVRPRRQRRPPPGERGGKGPRRARLLAPTLLRSQTLLALTTVPRSPTATVVAASRAATPQRSLPCGNGFCQPQPPAVITAAAWVRRSGPTPPVPASSPRETPPGAREELSRTWPFPPLSALSLGRCNMPAQAYTRGGLREKMSQGRGSPPRPGLRAGRCPLTWARVTKGYLW